MSRVVVTGMGLITSLGNDLNTSWDALCQGKSGVNIITSYDTSKHRVHFGAQIKDFDPLLYMDRKEARRNDPYEQLSIAVTKQALAQAGLEITGDIADDVGVYIGSGIGGLTSLHDQFRVLHEKGPDRISPFFINMMIIDGASGIVSILTGARGPNWAAVSACATSGNTIGEAWETIRRGDAKVMIAGGAEKAITPIAMAAFDNMHALSRRNDDPQGASRPFDATRDGFVMGEGAAVLILEDLEFAKARGATILAELVGYASTADAHHITDPAPGGEGMVRAMRRALQKANLRPEQVDYINAHGTSTPPNDRNETAAIKTCFGDHAYKLAVSSTKSMTGHTLGAAGAVESVISIQSILNNTIPPTINLHNPDPDCDLDYVPNEARYTPVNVAMSNSMGFGGHNTCLIFKRYEE
ncbi:3-oxoacyl-[acyl-carrier-protein] synthase II [Thermosporothrix hazakensis]|uniref:3-oxoacyl-[acyl-carrier-protein] synthase 2 n=1 Tax=Thermosporothrix hazakensis TaxID=644383 RepID=A0A326TVE1_THEHA|nr:beta-ketoacyl-ACP synthase II [Thermosporothrix hazakensis]PZW19374.1 3-oxoacyl-[acyl-carrier-protein] synthase II [Thermosporothrix hazakensis]GCE48041.1 3-oxoacyl-[acyl-carrier-protein] synthase 2 [Thermosporothrix hazakensis]